MKHTLRIDRKNLTTPMSVTETAQKFAEDNGYEQFGDIENIGRGRAQIDGVWIDVVWYEADFGPEKKPEPTSLPIFLHNQIRGSLTPAYAKGGYVVAAPKDPKVGDPVTAHPVKMSMKSSISYEDPAFTFDPDVMKSRLATMREEKKALEHRITAQRAEIRNLHGAHRVEIEAIKEGWHGVYREKEVTIQGQQAVIQQQAESIEQQKVTIEGLNRNYVEAQTKLAGLTPTPTTVQNTIDLANAGVEWIPNVAFRRGSR